MVWADPDPTRGSEQAKARPFAIVSVDQLNRAGLGISLVVPFTRTDFSNVLHLEVAPREGGLRERSFAMPEQLRVLSHERVSRRLGTLRSATLWSSSVDAACCCARPIEAGQGLLLDLC